MSQQTKVDLRRVRRTLRQFATCKRAAILRKYLKAEKGGYGEGDRFLGVRVLDVRRVAIESSGLSSGDLKTLISSPFHAERLFALEIMQIQYCAATGYIFSAILSDIEALD